MATVTSSSPNFNDPASSAREVERMSPLILTRLAGNESSCLFHHGGAWGRLDSVVV